MEGINDGPIMILVQDYVSKDIQKANTQVLANFVKQKPIEFENNVKRFFTGNGGGPLSIMKKDLNFEGVSENESSVPENLKVATMVICDLNEKKYYKRQSNTAKLTQENLIYMLKDFNEGKLEAISFTISN